MGAIWTHRFDYNTSSGTYDDSYELNTLSEGSYMPPGRPVRVYQTQPYPDVDYLAWAVDFGDGPEENYFDDSDLARDWAVEQLGGSPDPEPPEEGTPVAITLPGEWKPGEVIDDQWENSERWYHDVVYTPDVGWPVEPWLELYYNREDGTWDLVDEGGNPFADGRSPDVEQAKSDAIAQLMAMGLTT